MAAIVDDEAVADDDGVEALLFPLFVPVAVFSFADGVGDTDAREREGLQQVVQLLPVEQLLLYVPLQSLAGFLKGFKTGFACTGSQEVAGVAVDGLKREIYFVILHKDVKFGCKITKNREKPMPF